MRMIFSTVLGPHEPALTVGSLAMTETGRPPRVPLPVTTPSAPRPSSCQLASSPSSTKEPSSSSRATRSRTGSLPCSAAFARWRSGPPASARSTASSTSLIAPELSGAACRASCVPVDRPRDQRVRAQRPAEHALGLARGLEQAIQVDPGLDAHLVQHRDEVLRGDVAGRARRDRAAAELAEARLEAVAAGLQRRQHVGQPLAARVVEVRGQLDAVAERLARGGEELAHRARVGHPRRTPKPDPRRARRDEPPRDVEDALARHVALVGAAEADADDALAAQARLAGARQHALQPAQRLLDRAVDVLAVVRLARAEED